MQIFLKPSWLSLHLLILIVAVACVGLGFWQLERLDQRKARNALLKERLSERPRPLDDLLADYRVVAAHEAQSLAYRPALVEGEFDTRYEVLLRTSENYQGVPGYYLLTPLVLVEGEALLVRRGWVPFELNSPPVEEASPPEKELALQGVLNLANVPPTDWRASFSPKDPEGVLSITAYTDLSRLEEQMPYDLLPVYLDLSKQQPPQTQELPLPLEAPEFTEGPHLGYAIQWFAFALIAVVGYGFLLRNLAKNRLADQLA